MTEYECGLLAPAVDARIQQPDPFTELVKALEDTMKDHGIRGVFEQADDDVTVGQLLESRHYETDVPADADLDLLMATIRQAGLAEWNRKIARRSELIELKGQRQASIAFVDGQLVRRAYCEKVAPDEVVRAVDATGSPAPASLEASGWCGRIV